MIYSLIDQLISYAIEKKLIKKEDKIFHINTLLDLFELQEYKQENKISKMALEDILNTLLDYACKNKLCEDNSIARSLFDVKIMGLLTPKPSELISQFKQYYQKDPKKASDFFYQFNQDCNYIRTYQIKKDIKWQSSNTYGKFQITINLSKPEKDPKAIAKAKENKSTDYPKCVLCRENEAYAGNYHHPARQNLRILPIKLANENWFFQYSPYVYYKEHCIILNQKHTPMKICKKTFERLFDFLKIFPHYFIGSNADLPIVGGSILSHDHFQGGNHTFALNNAKIDKKIKIKNFENIDVGIVKWPLSIIRISSKDDKKLIELANFILKKWRNYSDKSVNILAKTQNIYHNTITPIARMKNSKFELDLVLRNNRTDKKHPFGIFHPHEHLHNIKKENIGLIEVMGLAILPPRLKEELKLLSDYILNNKNINTNEKIKKHAQWVQSFLPKYKNMSSKNIEKILQEEISKAFIEVLENCGVFKRNEQGMKAFEKFINTLSKN
ncbi:UDP-glucose--hexose-1-phosphate uridylyltransferase [Campylobacter aviculae]|uniref:Galactose-1-phosphate uridylyltransferase n=1 Tax=Campylobacter aviculae TaxID=2510190 RepID=A0A4V6DW09_9BACT|nr:UDP-glucose--hexose-1-phosphate uridylyltransferase [Campylobacter aviculae]TKX29472.1 galactose-1-phosphate uridylyltransferase [Campylobacter aviculae]